MNSKPPGDSRTYREFIKAVKSEQPCARLDERGRVRLCGACECQRVLEVIASNPVAENVHRDESPHELLTDFQESRTLEDGTSPPSDPIFLVNQKLYRDWLAGAFE
jgi:hypothetical protein